VEEARKRSRFVVQEQGVFILVYIKVGGVANGGAVVRVGGGMVARADEGIL